MNTESLGLPRPTQINLLAADKVDAIIEHECRELATLRSRARTVTATAAELEHQLAVERINPDTASWMLARMQRFVRDMMAEEQSEAAAILATAQRDAARAPQATRAFVSVVEALRPRLPDVLMDEQADRAIADARATVHWRATPVVPAPVTAPVVPAPVVAAPVVTPTLDEPPLEPASPPELAPTTAAESDFWPDGAKRSRRRRFRRPSVASALELGAASAAVIAVVVHFA